MPWLALFGGLVEISWFLTDDAFISFRYVRNLVEGHGLVFNRGERVEGYSNFLWVLELAALQAAFGLRPEHAAPWLSAAFTAATLAAMLWQVARLPSLPHRGLVGWMALGLVCSSATFAVWTSGGGLETRQFSFFVVLAVAGLSLYRDRRHALLAVSLSLAAAALTRPEGPLFAACCFAWYAVQRRVDTGRWRGEWPAVVCLVAPCVVLVAGHYLFRYAWYGEWLPNTYYAKHVRPWYEMGWIYLRSAALETGLYLWLPLAMMALWKEWRKRRCLTYALPLSCIVLHMAYISRIGGDHFEYRPLDLYWPLLAAPAAAGIVHLGYLGSCMVRACFPGDFIRRLRRSWPFASLHRAAGTRICALALFLPVLFYSSAMQGALLIEGAKVEEYENAMHLALDEENAGWLLAAPGMSMLTAVADDLRRQGLRATVGIRAAEHREFAARRSRSWRPYEDMERGVIPPDAVMAQTTIGISSYYLPDLTIIDQYGLTDATIARNPVVLPNHLRIIAHDRRPPAGYLEERGVNIEIHPAITGGIGRSPSARYLVKVGPDLWMPFDSDDHHWTVERFSGRALLDMYGFHHPTNPRFNLAAYGSELWIGDRFLYHFEDGFGNWRREGDAITNHGRCGHYQGQAPIIGSAGPGFLTSYHPTLGDGAVGRALSPEFTARDGRLLAFRVAGGSADGVGVRLLVEGMQVAVWRGRDRERFHWEFHLLAGIAGKRLQLEIFDYETGGWGHIMLDQVLLFRRQPGKRASFDRMQEEATRFPVLEPLPPVPGACAADAPSQAAQALEQALGDHAQDEHDRTPDPSHVDHVAAPAGRRGDPRGDLIGGRGQPRRQVHTVGHAGAHEPGLDRHDVDAGRGQPVA